MATNDYGRYDPEEDVRRTGGLGGEGLD